MQDNDPRYQAYLDHVKQLQEMMETSIPVTIHGTALLERKSTSEDTFQWVVGTEAQQFYEEHQITALVNLSEPGEPVFYFPSNRPDLAAYFKLKYGGVTVN